MSNANVNPALFGITISCVSDIDPLGRLITGFQVLTEALLRRLSTPRGRLLDDPDYGYDLTDEINDDLTTADIAAIAGRIDAELVKDPRVVSSTTSATFINGILNTTSALVTSVGPFTLYLAVSAVTVTLLDAPLSQS